MDVQVKLFGFLLVSVKSLSILRKRCDDESWPVLRFLYGMNGTRKVLNFECSVRKLFHKFRQENEASH